MKAKTVKRTLYPSGGNQSLYDLGSSEKGAFGHWGSCRIIHLFWLNEEEECQEEQRKAVFLSQVCCTTQAAMRMKAHTCKFVGRCEKCVLFWNQ